MTTKLVVGKSYYCDTYGTVEVLYMGESRVFVRYTSGNAVVEASLAKQWCERELIPMKIKVKKFLNLYKNGTGRKYHNSLEDAMNAIIEPFFGAYIRTIEVEWEEDECQG